VKTRTETSAGGVVFRPGDDDGRYDVALIRTHERRWQLPKGWIEPDETPEAAAIREVREEAGVDAELVGPLDRIEYWYNSNYEPEPARVHKFVHFFLLRFVGGSTEDHDDEVTEARWVEIGEADGMLAFRDERRMVAMARDALERVADGQAACRDGRAP
jgi:8-oxo-dGTP pyrophosphatase MutT (NUDIX family)